MSDPNGLAVQGANHEWHKLCGLMMHVLKTSEVVIRRADLDTFMAAYPNGGACVVMHEQADGIHMKLLPLEEGERLAAEHGRPAP